MSGAPSPGFGLVGVPGSGSAEPPLEEVGGKAWHLARIHAVGIAVPPGFVLPTAWSRLFLSGEGAMPELSAVLREGLAALEAATGRQFGGGWDPLLVSVRSGAPVSMPGMLDTVLNVGLSSRTLPALLRRTGHPRFCWDAFRRLLESWAVTVRGLPGEPFDRALAEAMGRMRIPSETELDVAALRELVQVYLGLHETLGGAPFPEDPVEQLTEAALAVFRSWRSPRAVEYRRLHRLADDLGTAVLVQAMVFGNLGGTSGSGVGFTRNPATGEPGLYLDFLFDSQGEDVVSGRRTACGADALEVLLPGVHAELLRLSSALERLFRDMQDFEFTVEEGQLWILQSRAAKRTAWAALRIAVDLVDEAELTTDEALGLLKGVDLERLRRERLVPGPGQQPIGHAVPASPGAATGVVTFTAARAVDVSRQGHRVILVRPDTSTADLQGMAAATGILTTEGSRTSHAAVVARQIGVVCLVGCRALAVDAAQGTARLGETVLREGDLLSLDGESGAVYLGEVPTSVERPDALLARVSVWRTASRATHPYSTSSTLGAQHPLSR